MKAFLSSLDMSFSMFSIIPMPRVEWKSENMKYALLCLPVIGLVIGLLLWGWGALCLHFSFGPLVTGAGFTLIPVLISGGIHVDGFLDTVDALSSHGDTEKKRAILKDSHAGAFAIIYACVYFLAFFAISAELPIYGWFVFLPGLVQIFSRCIAVLASIIYPSAAKQGMLYAFTDPLARTSLVVSIIETVVTAALMILCCWQCG
ncbi:MAG: adenosylcobinamide-GDP ribazoletransferase, partial [Parasporobacterium sp.]|nr:adenosylcobinamide-GDP ribazoletransferase [Parasporobacterium sp.]